MHCEPILLQLDALKKDDEYAKSRNMFVIKWRDWEGKVGSWTGSGGGGGMMEQDALQRGGSIGCFVFMCWLM